MNEFFICPMNDISSPMLYDHIRQSVGFTEITENNGIINLRFFSAFISFYVFITINILICQDNNFLGKNLIYKLNLLNEKK